MMLASESPPAVTQIPPCLTDHCQNDTFRTNDTDYNYSWPQHGMVCVFETTSEDFMTSPLFQTCVYFMYSVVFIVALLGNGLVCFVVHTSPRMKTVTNYFIVNLAVGDILMTVFCVPFSFVSMLALRYWPFGSVMCKVVNYSQAVSVLVSAYTLLAISIDRYLVIMHPLKPRLGKAAAKLVVAGVWGGALATAAPIPIVSQLQRPSLWHEACEVDICGEQWANAEQSEQYTCALLALQFALPLGALVCTYTRIAFVVWGGKPPGEAQSARDSRMQSSKRKMIKMMVTVVTVFTICWLPLNVFIVLWTVHESDDQWGSWPGMPYVWFACHWLAMSHSCYNPLIYCYMNARYRRGFKQILGGMLCMKSSDAHRSYHRSSICEGIPLSGQTMAKVWHDKTIKSSKGLIERYYPLDLKNPTEKGKRLMILHIEMVGVNASSLPRRGVMGCKCRSSCGKSSIQEHSKCATCSSLRQLKLLAPPIRTPAAPARALSIRSEF